MIRKNRNDGICRNSDRLWLFTPPPPILFNFAFKKKKISCSNGDCQHSFALTLFNNLIRSRCISRGCWLILRSTSTISQIFLSHTLRRIKMNYDLRGDGQKSGKSFGFYSTIYVNQNLGLHVIHVQKYYTCVTLGRKNHNIIWSQTNNMDCSLSSDRYL